MTAADLPPPAPQPVLPAGLRLAGRACVVVGGGTSALRQVVALVELGARVTVIDPTPTPAIDGLRSAAAITVLRRDFTDTDLDESWYVAAASGTSALNRQVAAAAEDRRILCCVPDRPEHGTVTVPVVGRHGQLRVAVHSTESAAHATALRDAIAAGLLDGTLVDRRHRTGAGGVALVGGGPGDPGLLTLRGRQLLIEADVVLADHLAPQSFLAGLPPEVEVIDASKIPRGPAMAQHRINALLIEHARAGRRVVRLKGGDPFVFGRGMEELQACAAAGIPVEVVPGVTSAVAVPGLAGIPVTHRGLTHELVVVTGHLAPDHPDSLVDWSALGRLRGTIVALMAVVTAGAIADRLIAEGRPPDTPVAVIERGGSESERITRTTLAGLGAAIERVGVRPPAVWVAGAVVGLMPAS